MIASVTVQDWIKLSTTSPKASQVECNAGKALRFCYVITEN